MAEKERWPVCSFMGDGEAVAVPHSKLKKKGRPPIPKKVCRLIVFGLIK